MTRGADLVMQTLGAAGVRDIFALSGNQIMPLFDASLDAGIRLYHTRHEAAAVYMAEAYAQIGGGIGVALVTAGAGLGNAIAPLLTARTSETPLLLLSGDSPATQDGQGAFQEMDQVGLTQSLTKWSVRPTRAEDLPETIATALHVAQSGRAGPVHVSLPADVLLAGAEASAPPVPIPEDAADLAELSRWIDAAETPLIVLGPALTDTRAPGLAGRIEAATGAPVLAMESPRGVNDPSLGHLAPVFARADRVVLLGKPLDFTLRFGAVCPDAGFAVVTADPEEGARAQRNAGDRLDLVLHADPRRVAGALAPGGRARPDWLREVQRQIARRANPPPVAGGIQPPDLCAAVQAAIDGVERPILICDGGEFGQWAQAGVTAPRRVINGVSGAIGGGLCYAMAARAADPSATVFALMGDGTIGFHLAEFETALRENLPFVAIIGNDGAWNAEYQIQLRDYGAGRTHGCTLTDARYDEAVRALGGFGARVTEAADLPTALAEAVASGRPACVNVRIAGLPAPVLR